MRVCSFGGIPVLYLLLAEFSFHVPTKGSAAINAAANANRTNTSLVYRMVNLLVARYGITRPGESGDSDILMSRQSDKFLIGQNRKFLLTADGLGDGTNRDEPRGTGLAG